jgi:hypothetical protein
MIASFVLARTGFMVADIGEAHVSGTASKLTSGVLTGGMVAILICAGIAQWRAHGAETAAVPNFSPDSMTGWLAQDDEFIQPPSGPGPIVSDPAHPYISFYKQPKAVIPGRGPEQPDPAAVGAGSPAQGQ